MSYSLDGKLANQFPQKMRLTEVRCAKCNRLFPPPFPTKLDVGDSQLQIYTYYGTSYSIYESKSGRSVCYCSDYCAKKHNHRFKKGE